jgi:hypothetical protein
MSITNPKSESTMRHGINARSAARDAAPTAPTRAATPDRATDDAPRAGLVTRQWQEADPSGSGRVTSRRLLVNPGESPLGWLHGRGLVDDRQCAAGEQLRRDYEAAAMGQRVTMRWDTAPAMRGSGRTGAAEAVFDATERQIAARARFHAAMDALGPGLQDIAWRIICAGEGMTTAERALSWPARSGRIILTLALDRLAGHYRMG